MQILSQNIEKYFLIDEEIKRLTLEKEKLADEILCSNDMPPRMINTGRFVATRIVRKKPLDVEYARTLDATKFVEKVDAQRINELESNGLDINWEYTDYLKVSAIE